MSVLQGEEWGCRPEAPAQSHWLWGLPSAWHGLGVGWRGRGSDLLAVSQG